MFPYSDLDKLVLAAVAEITALESKLKSDNLIDTDIQLKLWESAQHRDYKKRAWRLFFLLPQITREDSDYRSTGLFPRIHQYK